MHSPATTPDDIKATPDRIPTTTSSTSPHGHIVRNLIQQFVRSPTQTATTDPSHPATPAHNATQTTTAYATSTATLTPRTTAADAPTPHTATADAPTTHKPATAGTTPQRDPSAPIKQSVNPSPTPDRHTRSPRVRPNKWLHYATVNRERGMSTAEYAVGTIAACAFAALLFKVVSSPEVQEMLTSLIDRALNTTKE